MPRKLKVELDLTKIKTDYIVAGRSMPEIAAMCQVSTQTIRRRLLADGITPEHRPVKTVHRCPVCHETKPLTPEFFYRNKAHAVGLATTCKACYHLFIKKTKETVMPETKQCYECGETKPFTAEFFYHRAGSRWGLSNLCKLCRRRHLDYRPKGQSSVCRGCGNPRTEENTYKNNNRRSSMCKDCLKQRRKNKSLAS